MAWRCKKCGGPIFIEADVSAFIQFEVEKNGNIGKARYIPTWKEILSHGMDLLYYYCEECDNKTHTINIDGLKEIAQWEES